MEETSVVLPYSGEEFRVPSNVYILGTMNTADRSIALMDTALRRRFRIIEMMPDSDVLRKTHADKVEDLDVAAMLDKINERITFLYDREHTIGHAFFIGLQGKNATLERLQSIFEKSLIPLLQEYFYKDYQKIQLVLGDNAKSSDDLKFILDEKVVAKNIFKGNVEDIMGLPEKRYTINKVAFGNINSYEKDFSQVVINRNTKDYEMLIQWSKVFLMNKSFTTFSGSTTSRALLFPMELVYESYVAQQMKKVMSTKGWDVSRQDKGYYLFTGPRRQFALRPDIVMKKGERTIILDTKWKSLVNNERVNYGISQADMYQMYAYSKKYNIAILPYPLEGNGFTCKKYLEEHLSICVPDDHALAKFDSINTNQINGYNCLLNSDIGFWIDMCRKSMPSSKFLVQTDEFAFRELMTASNLPYFTTDLANDRFAEVKNRVTIPITDEEANVSYYLCQWEPTLLQGSFGFLQ